MQSIKKITLTAFMMLVVVFLSSCGQTVRESISTHNYDDVVKNKINKKVVLLPLADYTQGKTPDDNMRRQVKLNTAINHRLSMYGLYSPLQEDVVQELVEMGIVKKVDAKELNIERYKHLRKEIGFDWSKAMYDEIMRIYALNEAMRASSGSLKYEKIGLNKDAIRALGERFDAEYVIRGRIVEYEIRDGHSLNPFQRGILPVFFGVTSNAIFGVAKSELYDLWHDLSIGGALGAVIGAELKTPFNPPKKDTTVIIEGDHPRFMTERVVTDYHGGFDLYRGLNAGVWGAAGATAAYLSSKGGKIPQAVVQVSLALQRVEDGSIVWQNRVEKEVEPFTVWANPTDRTVMDRAIEEAAISLIDDLAKALKSMPEKKVEPVAMPVTLPALVEEPLPPPQEVMPKEPVKTKKYRKSPPLK